MIETKSLIIVFLLGVLFDSKKCNTSKNDFIIWTNSRKLKREDFEGTKPDSSNASAGAAIRLRLNYVIKGMSTSFDVRCLFFKKESWYVYSDTRRLILLHEQGHFDIGEIVARNLRKDLSEAVKKTPVISPRRIDSISRVHTKALVDMQDLYDNETNHSLIIDEQERWNQQIRKMLDSLDTYSANKFR
jgi:hypothetical protein